MTDQRAMEKAVRLVANWFANYPPIDIPPQAGCDFTNEIAVALLEACKEGMEKAAGIADNVPCETVEKKRLAASIAQAIRQLKEEV